MAGALDGVTVIEFGSNLCAAYAAMLLAEQGARTIRVEFSSAADPRLLPDSSHYRLLNRSKQIVRIEYESPAGKETAQGLIRSADIVVSGFTPARQRGLGLDYETLRALNPRLIALATPPMGSEGPEADLDASDDLVAARAGITGSQWARSGNPVALAFPAASYSAAVMGAASAVAALFARSRAGGQSVEVSVLAGALSLQTGGVMRHEKMTTLYHGPQDPLGPIPCYRLYEAADGRYLFIACGNTTFWNKFALAIEKPELVSDPRFENAPWGIPPDNWQTLKDIIAPIIRSRTRSEWLEILRSNDVPCAPVLSRQEFIDSPQVRALGMCQEIADPVLGATIQPGIPVELQDSPGKTLGPPQLADEAEIQKIIRDSQAEKKASQITSEHPGPGPRADSAGPLAGITVLDFTSYIAGSYGPMILGQMGADVIKIETERGDSFRTFGFGFLGWNQQKRSLTLDLHRAEARKIVYALTEKADVVVENLRPGRAKAAGIDYETLAAINPRIVYMSVNGYGNRGPEYLQPAFDPLLQAHSGVMAAQGGHHHHPVYLTCAICDYGAAMLSAFGCILALQARHRTGRGQSCQTSLLQAAMAFQAGEFVFHETRRDLEDGHPERRGRSALSRAYQCRAEKWLFIDILTDAQWTEMASLVGGLSGIAFKDAEPEESEGKLAEMLSAFFAAQDRDSILEQLRRAGIPIQPVNRFADLFEDPQVLANRLLVELNHSKWGRVIQTGMLTKFSATPGAITRAAPLLGEHSQEIIASLREK
jgi:crotonobetainyl-CoA:carnitine CoA-transferase CaiB-like acyl-CoA transferase